MGSIHLSVFCVYCTRHLNRFESTSFQISTFSLLFCSECHAIFFWRKKPKGYENLNLTQNSLNPWNVLCLFHSVVSVLFLPYLNFFCRWSKLPTHGLCSFIFHVLHDSVREFQQVQICDCAHIDKTMLSKHITYSILGNFVTFPNVRISHLNVNVRHVTLALQCSFINLLKCLYLKSLDTDNQSFFLCCRFTLYIWARHKYIHTHGKCRMKVEIAFVRKYAKVMARNTKLTWSVRWF